MAVAVERAIYLGRVSEGASGDIALVGVGKVVILVGVKNRELVESLRKENLVREFLHHCKILEKPNVILVFPPQYSVKITEKREEKITGKKEERIEVEEEKVENGVKKIKKRKVIIYIKKVTIVEYYYRDGKLEKFAKETETYYQHSYEFAEKEIVDIDEFSKALERGVEKLDTELLKEVLEKNYQDKVLEAIRKFYETLDLEFLKNSIIWHWAYHPLKEKLEEIIRSRPLVYPLAVHYHKSDINPYFTPYGNSDEAGSVDVWVAEYYSVDLSNKHYEVLGLDVLDREFFEEESIELQQKYNEFRDKLVKVAEEVFSKKIQQYYSILKEIAEQKLKEYLERKAKNE